MHRLLNQPRRVLLTLDAVGGVWSYALAAAAMLGEAGIGIRLVGLGPPPTAERRRAVERLPSVELTWLQAPLDWMVDAPAALAGVAPALAAEIHAWQPDLVHLAAASQAVGLGAGPPLAVQSHSCLPSWWDAVHGGALQPDWTWHLDYNQAGFGRADAVIVPSASHGHALARLYGGLPLVHVVPNAAPPAPALASKQPYVFAAGRWWDEGKNAALLDQAAALAPWPVLMAGDTGGMAFAHATALGALGPAAMQEHLAHAALFAAPSRYEPFGLAVLEAANAGAALLLADIPTFRELWADAALFLDPADPAGWAAVIGRLAADPAERAARGAAARRRAATFSFDRQRTALLAAYAHAMQRQPAFV